MYQRSSLSSVLRPLGVSYRRMVPEQENALRDPDVHARIARAHLLGLERFLAARAAAGHDR